jgi:hypothetical protein
MRAVVGVAVIAIIIAGAAVVAVNSIRDGNAEAQPPPVVAPAPVPAPAPPPPAAPPAVAQPEPAPAPNGNVPPSAPDPAPALAPTLAQPTLPPTPPPAPVAVPAVAAVDPNPEKGTTVAMVTPPANPQPRADPDAEFNRLLREGKRANAAERFKTAAISYRKALGVKPDSADAKAGLGIALVNGSEDASYKEAVKLLEEATKAEDTNSRAWLALGMAYQFTKQTGPAVEAYKKYLALEPSGESAGDVRSMLKELGR